MIIAGGVLSTVLQLWAPLCRGVFEGDFPLQYHKWPLGKELAARLSRGAISSFYNTLPLMQYYTLSS